MAITLATGSAQGSNCATLTPLYPTTGSYAYSSDDPGEAIYANVAGALDQPNTIRYALSGVKNMFAQSSLTPLSGQRVDGISALVQVNEVWKFDDAADALAPYYFPVSAHLVVKVPNDALVTSTVFGDLIRRLVGAVYRNGTDAYSVAFANVMHGVLRY